MVISVYIVGSRFYIVYTLVSVQNAMLTALESILLPSLGISADFIFDSMQLQPEWRQSSVPPADVPTEPVLTEYPSNLVSLVEFMLYSTLKIPVEVVG